MERALSADLERVASSINNDSDGEADSMNIQLLSNDSSLDDAQIQVPEGQIVGDAIQAAYPDLQMKGVVVSMGGEEIDMELSFSENGIEDGARLEVEAPTHLFWHCFSPFFAQMCHLLRRLHLPLGLQSPCEGVVEGGGGGSRGAPPWSFCL